MKVPGFKRFFSLSLDAKSSEDSLDKFRSLAKSLSSWENSCGGKTEGGRSLYTKEVSVSVEKRSSSLEIVD